MSKIEAAYNSIFTDYPDVVSVKQLAEMLGTGRSFTYRLIHERRIGYTRIGRDIIIPKIYIISYILHIDIEKKSAYHLMFKGYPDVVTVKDLSKMLCIGRNSSYNLVHQNRIQFVRIGRDIFVPKICIVDFLLNDFKDVEYPLKK